MCKKGKGKHKIGNTSVAVMKKIHRYKVVEFSSAHLFCSLNCFVPIEPTGHGGYEVFNVEGGETRGALSG